MPRLRRVKLGHRINPSAVSMFTSLHCILAHSGTQLDKLPLFTGVLKYHGIPRGLAGTRRNAGRDDATTWNGSHFISAAQVDGYPDSEESETEVEGDMTFVLQMIDALEAREKINSRSSDVSLLEMARPAKVRGKSGLCAIFEVASS